MPRFVLIPGAGADPRVHGATIAALEALGHEGLAPPLPLDDAEAGPSDHAAVILGPGPGMFTEPWPLPAWPSVPTRVLAPTEDRLFQRRIARERLGLAVETMSGGHVPMLARPQALAGRRVELTEAG